MEFMGLQLREITKNWKMPPARASSQWCSAIGSRSIVNQPAQSHKISDSLEARPAQ
jgi:hypothetical protein